MIGENIRSAQTLQRFVLEKKHLSNAYLPQHSYKPVNTKTSIVCSGTKQAPLKVENDIATCRGNCNKTFKPKTNRSSSMWEWVEVNP